VWMESFLAVAVAVAEQQLSASFHTSTFVTNLPWCTSSWTENARQITKLTKLIPHKVEVPSSFARRPLRHNKGPRAKRSLVHWHRRRHGRRRKTTRAILGGDFIPSLECCRGKGGFDSHSMRDALQIHVKSLSRERGFYIQASAVVLRRPGFNSRGLKYHGGRILEGHRDLKMMLRLRCEQRPVLSERTSVDENLRHLVFKCSLCVSVCDSTCSIGARFSCVSCPPLPI